MKIRKMMEREYDLYLQIQYELVLDFEQGQQVGNQNSIH